MVTATLGQLHERVVFNRRVSVLGEALGALVDAGSTILDVGTGDGQIAKLVAAQAPDTAVRGIDIMARPTSHIPVDLLRWPDDPASRQELRRGQLRRCAAPHRRPQCPSERSVAGGAQGGDPEGPLFGKRVRPHDAALHGLGRQRAPRCRAALQLRLSREMGGLVRRGRSGIETVSTDVPLYPAPFSLVFGRGLHFVARLTPLA
jgi:hypothetical protein